MRILITWQEIKEKDIILEFIKVTNRDYYGLMDHIPQDDYEFEITFDEAKQMGLI